MVLSVLDDQAVALSAGRNLFNRKERSKFNLSKPGEGNCYDPFRKATKLLEMTEKDFKAMETHAKIVEDGVSKNILEIIAV